MAEPVTIGGQTFIKTGDGWVDQKSKIRAPEGLLSLLNRLQIENSSEGKKKRVRIDTSRPVVKLGKTEYVWDLNSNVWIDKKTKDAANPAFSKLIEAAYQGIIEGTTEEEKLYESWAKTAAAGQVFSGMGATGQAGKQKVRTLTGGGQLPAPNIKINSPIVQMIEKLATIDGYLKQKLDNQKKIASRTLIMAKETAIEAKSGDASPVEQTSENDAEKSDATGIGVALLVGGLIAAQFEPVQEAFKSLASGIKSVFNFVGSVAKTISDGLDFFTGSSSTSDSSAETDSTTIPDINQAGTPSSPNAATQAPLSIPSETNKTLPSVATPISSSAPTPEPANNSRSTKPVATSSGDRDSSRINNTSGMSSNSGSRISAPSPTRSDAAPTASAPALPSASASTPATPKAATSNNAAAPGNANNVPQPTPAGAGMSYIQTASGQKTKVSAQHAEKFQGFISDLEATGYKINSLGGYANRNVAGTNKKSYHAQGMAIDINPQQNPHTFPGDSNYGQTNMPANVGALAKKHGLGWGGNWRSSKDTMHFSAAASEQGTAPDPRGDVAQGGGIFEQIATAGVDLTEGAIKAVGNILSAALGPMSITTGSQLQNSFNSTMSSDIGKAAREKTNAIVDSKIIESAAATIKSSSTDTKASASSSQMQIAESTGDNASIQYYLTRMGFAPIDYKQAATV